MVVFAVACHAPAAQPVISARTVTVVDVAKPLDLSKDFSLDLVALPPLPEKRGIDLAGEGMCRALLERRDDLPRLVRVATLTGGDCQIDVDRLLGDWAPYRVGGCTGASPDEAMLAWNRVALVATTQGRRRAALYNVAQLAWYFAWRTTDADAWTNAGDAFVRASRDDDALVLAVRAVDAYENALRLPKLSAKQVGRIARGLAQIHDGAAGDRAVELRARLRY